MEAKADEEAGAATGACCNQRSRVDCRPPDCRRPEGRGSTAPSHFSNEERSLPLFQWKRARVQPGPARPTDKRSNISDRSLSFSHTRALFPSLSLSLSLLFFYILPSRSLCLSSRSVCLYQEYPQYPHSLTRRSLTPFLSILSVSVSFFYLHLEKICLVVIELSSHTQRSLKVH